MGNQSTTMAADSKGFYSDEDSEFSDYSGEDSFYSSDEFSDEEPRKPAPSKGGFGKKPAKKPQKLDQYGFPMSDSEEEESDFSDYSDEEPQQKKPTASVPKQSAPSNDFLGFGAPSSTPAAKPAASDSFFGFGSSNQPAPASSAKPSSDLLSLDFDAPSGGSSVQYSGLSSGNSQQLNFGEPVRARLELLKQVVGN